ncbi:MAG: PhoH family protein [Clostridia bacterium]|nr:PhoH family protein [Clostridia bacterium]
MQELEKIKVSQNKDVRIKHTARTLLHLLDEHINEYICLIYTDNISNNFAYLELNNDGKIIASILYALDKRILTENSEDKIIFYTNDLAMKQLASAFLPIEVKSIIIKPDNYTGYKDIDLSDEELALLYEGHLNLPNIQINEYVNIWDCRGDRVDTLCWTGSEFRPLKYKTFESDWFGNIKPYKDDIFQAMAADSLLNNQITMLRGPSGAGKSHLALGYLFYLLEHNRIDKIIVFCNTVATRNAAKLGYYPGDKNEKLLDAQIGNMLSSKLGGQEAVLRLIEENKLILLPMSDIRGYDTSGMNAGIYITEA